MRTRRFFVIGCLGAALGLCAAPAHPQAEPRAHVIRSAAEYDYPPLCFVTGEGQATGFSVELLKAAVGAMGPQVTFDTGSWPVVKRQLVDGEIDVLPLVGRTPEREASFDFTFSYLSLHGVIVVRKGTRDIHEIGDLNGRSVAVLKDDNAHEYLRRTDPGCHLYPVVSFKVALRGLSLGDYDAVVIQHLLALYLIDEIGLTNLEIVDGPLTGFRQDFCFAVSEGDKETLALLNEGLALVMADGTLKKLQARWLGALEKAAVPIGTLLWWFAGIAIPSLVVALMGLVWIARRQVRSRTAELRRKETHYRSVIHGLHEDILIIDPEYFITDINNTALQTRGFKREEVIGRPCYALLHGLDTPCHEQGIACPHQRVFETGEACRLRHEYADADGNQRHTDILASPLVDENGNVGYLIEAVRDITDLVETQSLIESIFSTTPGFLVMKDRQCVYRVANAAFCEFLGKSQNEIIGKTDYDLFPPDEAEAYRKGDVEVMATGMSESGDWEVTGARGKTWMHVDKTAILGSSGECTGTLCSVVDISRRKQTENELIESERRWRTLTDNLPGVVYRCSDDPDWPMELVSRGAMELTGYTSDELTAGGTPVFGDLIHAEDRQNVVDAVRAGVEENRPFEIEYRLTKKDGKIRWLWERGQAVPNGSSDHGVLEGFISDITDKVRNEAGLRRLQAAVEQAAETVIITDIDGNIQYVNPAFEAVSGYAAADVIGRNPRILQSGEHDAAFYRNLWATLKADRIWVGRFINRRKDGVLVTEEGTIASVRDTRGAIVNYVAVRRDVTRELELEEQYNQVKKMEAIGALAGGVAHDMNNLLAPILMGSEMLLRELHPGDERREWVEEIRGAGTRARDLVRQLLLFGRQEPMAVKTLDLNEVISGFEKLLRRMLREDTELEIVLAASKVSVCADAGQLEQMLMNLVGNAQDALPEGGLVRLESGLCRRDEIGNTTQPARPADRYARLVVKDDGIGMDEQTKARIFEPFFTTKQVGKGTGLGLATVYAIVDQHGGFLRVESAPGQGTTFSIFLPITNEVMASEEEIEEELYRRTGLTALVVEDEEGVRRLLEQCMVEMGFKVLMASSSEEGLRLLKEHPGRVHLLLTDVILPDRNGRWLATQVVAQRPGVKVLYMSGYPADVIGRHGVLEEKIAFLRKPFTGLELADKIHQTLEE